ncbi:ATP-binding protein [Actinoplanes sp. N902-109]|uniref:sensor histidine kinase n=1 Tax=Actinoplanes sp. (strain N902-109) TaxID=649831 RepID=UPI0003293631|nr:sensor histidine kinase [Actinoplanes sp. N902-109]AGL18024.1 multi-sensor signal transduction histidine kinase [Actinoplanes sp. N902-109]
MAICGGLSLLLVALSVVAAVIAQDSSDQLDVVINKTGPMRTSGQTLDAAFVDQETGVRGFLLSGNEANLAPYERGRTAETQLLDQIGTLNATGHSDAAVTASLDLVRQRAAEWRATVAEPLITSVRTSGPRAGQALPLASDTTHFDAVRAAVQQLQADIATVRNAAVERAKNSGGSLVALEVIAAAAVIVAGAALMLLLDRLINRPVLELATQVRAVAAGDYDRDIAGRGAPELLRLAEDVDAMRRKISAELREMQEARAQIEWGNAQLKVQADELTRSNRDLEQFAYVASHDLQEPLRKVASFCQLLQRRYAGQLDARADQYIAFAVDGAERMQRLINDLLAFSRIGRLTSGFTEVDLDRVLTQVRSQLEERAGPDATITWTGLPAVRGEEPLLTTLFANLIGNSLKFRRPGVPPEITVTAAREDDHWALTVRDNGIGIEPEFADKIFVIFQRLHPRETYEGTGIGLAIVKKIVEYHGGTIALDTTVSPGAGFHITLPVTDAAAGAPPASAENRVADNDQ